MESLECVTPHAEGVELVGRGGGLEPLPPQPTGLSVLGHEGLVSVPFCNGFVARGVGWNRKRGRWIVGLGVATEGKAGRQQCGSTSQRW